MNEAVNTNQSNKKAEMDREGVPLLSRTEVLEKLAGCINMVHQKVKTGRIRNTDKQKHDMLKVQGYLTGIYLQGLKDLEIDQLVKRIEKLEQAKEKEK